MKRWIWISVVAATLAVIVVTVGAAALTFSTGNKPTPLEQVVDTVVYMERGPVPCGCIPPPRR